MGRLGALKDGKLGCFGIPENMLVMGAKWFYVAVLRDIAILSAQYQPGGFKGVRYVGICSMFDSIKENDRIPFYEIRVNNNSGKIVGVRILGHVSDEDLFVNNEGCYVTDDRCPYNKQDVLSSDEEDTLRKMFKDMD